MILRTSAASFPASPKQSVSPKSKLGVLCKKISPFRLAKGRGYGKLLRADYSFNTKKNPYERPHHNDRYIKDLWNKTSL
jgi:hypothetical protein